jgi:drug/metabolite transporter (DMT)-like permease
MAVVVASLSYAIAGLYAQRRLTSASGPALATAAMFGGAVALLPLSIVFAPDHAPHWKPVASLAALTLFGTALAQLILYRALRHHGAASTSLVTYLMPPIALLYGVVLLDEHVTAATLGGLALILAGVALGRGAWRSMRRRAPAIQEP